MSYQSDLRKPQWQRKRLEIFQRDEWACQACGETENPLLVHHFGYLPGRRPWQYDGHYLVTVCFPCHDRAHSKEPMEWSLSVWERWRDNFYKCPQDAHSRPPSNDHPEKVSGQGVPRDRPATGESVQNPAGET